MMIDAPDADVQPKSDGGPGAQTLDYQQIRQYNRQRYPIALVDCIERGADGSFVGIKAVTAMEACYAHLTDDATAAALAYPESLIIESFCQTAWPMCLQDGVVTAANMIGKVIMIASVGSVEFTGQVFPGGVMRHHPHVASTFSEALVLAGHTQVGERIIARFGRIIITWRDSERVP